MDDEGVFVRLEAADQRVDRAVAIAKNVFHLRADFVGVAHGRFRVVVKTGAATLGIPLRIMVGDDE